MPRKSHPYWKRFHPHSSQAVHCKVLQLSWNSLLNFNFREETNQSWGDLAQTSHFQIRMALEAEFLLNWCKTASPPQKVHIESQNKEVNPVLIRYVYTVIIGVTAARVGVTELDLF